MPFSSIFISRAAKTFGGAINTAMSNALLSQQSYWITQARFKNAEEKAAQAQNPTPSSGNTPKK
ncbi:MAG: hypothetical protein EPO11_00865 [Gammaproteobacteria bacterium]|nr:MAG: hypothetical protein EPO11_00865 [Gammaproteobacteria bacterium]